MEVIDWPQRRCSGESCKQARAECKTPQACELPLTEAERPLAERLLLRVTPAQFWVAYGIAIGVCIGAALAHLFARFGA